MNITKYIVKNNIQILNTLFLKNEEIYASDSFHVMNGVFGYARKVFNSDRKYLGMIDDDNFPERSLERQFNQSK